MDQRLLEAEIFERFAGMHMETVPVSYSVGKVTDRRELIVFSRDLAAKPAGLF